uniref:Uncharacterized protein n=1 Tax=Anopheles albimanus TaxID=7167 RepID=A0A182FD69_ANOAL
MRANLSATSVHSPLATPTKSPVNQPKYPAYPQQQNRAPYYPQQQQQQQPQQRAGYGASPSPRSPGVPVGSPRSPGATLNASPRGWAHVASPVPTYRPSSQHQQLSSPSPSSPSAPFYQQPSQQPAQQPHRPGYQVFVPPPLVAQPVQPGFAHGGSGGGGGGGGAPCKAPHRGHRGLYQHIHTCPEHGLRTAGAQQYQRPIPTVFNALSGIPEDQPHQPLAAQFPNTPQQQQQQQPYTYQPQATQAFQPLTAQQQSQAAATAPYQPIQPQYHQQQQLPPTLVTTLRKEPPMSQEPAPVYQTQPVAAIYQGKSERTDPGLTRRRCRTLHSCTRACNAGPVYDSRI